MKKIIILFILIFSTIMLRAQKPYSMFNHICIHVSNLDRSVAFYTSLFQLDSIADPFRNTGLPGLNWENMPNFISWK